MTPRRWLQRARRSGTAPRQCALLGAAGTGLRGPRGFATGGTAAATARLAALPLRSALYTPGSRQRAVAKGRDSSADCLILDLEDAVAPGAKEEARRVVLDELSRGGYGRRLIAVRCNGLDSPWGREDLEALGDYCRRQAEGRTGAQRVAAVCLPKVESAAQVRECLAVLDGGRPADPAAAPALWAMVETPRGVLAADGIAGGHARVGCLVAGTSDLAKDLHAQPSACRTALLYSLSAIVLAARANGVMALDGVHLDLADDAGFAASCAQGRQLGFDGKTLIHPKTIAAANEAFSPSPAEVDRARRIIEEHRRAVARGEGVAVVDGQLVENLHVEHAERVCRLAAAVSDPPADA